MWAIFIHKATFVPWSRLNKIMLKNFSYTESKLLLEVMETYLLIYKSYEMLLLVEEGSKGHLPVLECTNYRYCCRKECMCLATKSWWLEIRVWVQKSNQVSSHCISGTHLSWRIMILVFFATENINILYHTVGGYIWMERRMQVHSVVSHIIFEVHIVVLQHLLKK